MTDINHCAFYGDWESFFRLFSEAPIIYIIYPPKNPTDNNATDKKIMIVLMDSTKMIIPYPIGAGWLVSFSPQSSQWCLRGSTQRTTLDQIYEHICVRVIRYSKSEWKKLRLPHSYMRLSWKYRIRRLVTLDILYQLYVRGWWDIKQDYRYQIKSNPFDSEIMKNCLSIHLQYSVR